MKPLRKLRFEYGKQPDGLFYWHIRAKNSEIVAQGEGYKRRAGVLKVFTLLFTGEIPEVVDLDAKPLFPGVCLYRKKKGK